jgi:hypothetical protein
MADAEDRLWKDDKAVLIDRVRELEGLLAGVTRQLEQAHRRVADPERLLASRASRDAIAYAGTIDAAYPGGCPFVVVTLDPDTMTLAVDSCGFEIDETVAWLMVEATAHVNASRPLQSFRTPPR